MIRGPEATAGLTLNLYRIKGIIIPANVPIIKVNRSELLTTKPRVKLPCHTNGKDRNHDRTCYTNDNTDP